MTQDRREEKWHVGKEIPIAMLFAIVVQTGGAIWWSASFSATVTTKLDDLSLQVAAINADRYTQRDAQKDQALVFQKIKEVQDQVIELKHGGDKWRR